MSPIVSISEQVRQKAPGFKRETGQDFIYFQRGEIDFQTPDYIVQAAKRSMFAGRTKYPQSGGEPGLKEAIIEKMEQYNKADGLDPENVLVTYGGQEALQLAFKLFEGKKGAGFSPCWSCTLENFVPYNQVEFIEVPLNKDFSVQWEKLQDALKEVAFFYLNTPQNPTGKVFTKEEVLRISELCERFGVYLISDEAYERIVFDNLQYFSPASIQKPHIISCFTMSKAYAMTGWRIGYLICRDERIVNMLRLGDYSQTAGVVTFVQDAAAEALRNLDSEIQALTPMLNAYEERRDRLYELLNAIDGLKVEKPQGAFYFFPDCSALIPPGLSWQQQKLYIFNLLMDAGVAVVYGACFGNDFVNNIRISYSATNLEQIETGIARMQSAFANSQRRMAG